MSSLPKLKRDHAAADLAAVEGMLAGLTDEDVVIRMSLEGRKEQILEELAALPAVEERWAQAAVYFGGRPVVGSLGIESEFGGRAVTMLQDLVAKQFAQDTDGGLGQRGVIANKGSARLHVTDIVRGSFGFRFEQLQPQAPMFDTSLKAALDHVSALLAAFAEADEKLFEAAIENVDERVLAEASEFFSFMDREGATLRMVAGEADRAFDAEAVTRAARRAISTSIVDKDEDIVGQLAGVLPEGHRFEFRCESPRGVIGGKIDRSLSSADAAQLAADWVNKTAVATVTTRQVLKDGEVVRESFTLRGIRACPAPTAPPQTS